MQTTINQIKRAFGGRLIAKPKNKTLICRALTHLPPDMLNFVTKNVWLISESPDAWAFTLNGSDVKNQHLIFLSETLFFESQSQINSTIIHEIGHIVLHHRNSIGFHQSLSEIRRQERAATHFARTILNPNL